MENIAVDLFVWCFMVIGVFASLFGAIGYHKRLKRFEEKPDETPVLSRDIFKLPNCPGWAAVDADGVLCLYSEKPIISGNTWTGKDEAACFNFHFDASDWQNSLIERPAAKSESQAADLPEHDDVKAPSYYVNTPFGMELKKITCHYDFNCGSALKYIIRHGKKVYGGMTAKESAIKDLGKAIECLQNEIEYIKENWEK